MWKKIGDGPEGTSIRKFFHPVWRGKEQRRETRWKKKGVSFVSSLWTYVVMFHFRAVDSWQTRDKREQRILPKYIFFFFRDETSCKLRPLRFLLILSKEVTKEISGNITAFSISRNKLCVSSYVFHPLIVFCLPKNQYSGGEMSIPRLLAPLWTVVSRCFIVFAHGQCHAPSKSPPCFAPTANYFPVADTPPRASKRLCQGSGTA